MREISNLLDDIYPLIQNRSDTAFPEFGFRRTSIGWEATKGQINGIKAKDHLYHYDNTPFCFKNHKTGEVITLWNYIQDKKRLLTTAEIIGELAGLANYTLPGNFTDYSDGKVKRIREKAALLEKALDYFNTQLWTEKGKETLNYLKKKRGYTETEIKAMELGFYSSQKEIEAELAKEGYDRDAIKEAGLKTRGFGETHMLFVPYRDPLGRLKGLAVRAIKDKVKPRYLYSSGMKRDTLFNLNEARGEKDLIVTEGYLDALISTQRGIKGVVATGGSSITKTQLEDAVRYKVKSFILALDNDSNDAGQTGTERSIKLINEEGLKSYVITLPEGYDPDDLLREKGVDAFKKAIKEAQSGVKWMAQRILSRYNRETDKGRDDALEEALIYEETIKDPLDRKDFSDSITTTLDIPRELLEPRIKDYHEKKARERLQRGYNEFFKEGLRLLEKGKLTDIKGFIEEKTKGLKVIVVSKAIKPPYRFNDLERDIIQTPEGLKTGYKKIDDFTRIPQGAITIIAGRPSHGKTTFLMNLLLNVAEIYKDKRFFFFSYEENRRKVGLKFLNILSGEELDKKQNMRKLERYIRGGNKFKPKIEEGKRKYESLTESGRLWIIDEPYYVDDLVDTIICLKEIYDNIGAIFIDYFQKIKIKEKSNTRQLEIQKISNRILEVANNLSIPIILGAQVNREVKNFKDLTLDKLREAGDIEQDTNVAIGLYNETKEKLEENRDDVSESVIELKLRILKNRDGNPNRDFTLYFNTPILTISDEPPNQGPFS